MSSWFRRSLWSTSGQARRTGFGNETSSVPTASIRNRSSYWNVPLQVSRLHDTVPMIPVIWWQWRRGTGTMCLGEPLGADVERNLLFSDRRSLQLFQLLADLVGSLRIARQRQVFRVGGARCFVVLQLFIGLAQPQPGLRFPAVPLGGFLEGARRGAVGALLEVLVADVDFLLRLQRIEAVHGHRNRLVFLRRQSVLIDSLRFGGVAPPFEVRILLREHGRHRQQHQCRKPA